MTSFNINNVVKSYSLDTKKLAEVLFPTAKYPALALDRIIKGEASLSVVQLEKLASFIGISPSDLFRLDTWTQAHSDGYLTFKKGPFEVKLNYNGAFLTLYKNGEVVDKRITGSDMTIDQFVTYIEDLITNFS